MHLVISRPADGPGVHRTSKRQRRFEHGNGPLCGVDVRLDRHWLAGGIVVGGQKIKTGKTGIQVNQVRQVY